MKEGMTLVLVVWVALDEKAKKVRSLQQKQDRGIIAGDWFCS